MDHKTPHHSQTSPTAVRFSLMEDHQSISMPVDLPEGVGMIAASGYGWGVYWNPVTGMPYRKNVLTNASTIVPPPDERYAVIYLAAPARSLKFRIAAYEANVLLTGADGQVVWEYGWVSNENGPYLFEKSFEESFVVIRLQGALSCSDIELNVDPAPTHER